MIRAIIFDLGRVLIDIELGKGFVERILALGIKDLSSLGKNAAFLDYSTGRISSEEFYDKVVERFSIEESYEEFSELWCNIFSEMAGMKELVRKISGAYPIGLLSDTDPLHWNYITTKFPWINTMFHAPVLSYEIGVMKPDKKAFIAAACSVGVQPEECVFIDDLEKNIAGAREVGMTVIKFSGVSNLIIELEELGISF